MSFVSIIMFAFASLVLFGLFLLIRKSTKENPKVDAGLGILETINKNKILLSVFTSLCLLLAEVGIAVPASTGVEDTASVMGKLFQHFIIGLTGFFMLVTFFKSITDLSEKGSFTKLSNAKKVFLVLRMFIQLLFAVGAPFANLYLIAVAYKNTMLFDMWLYKLTHTAATWVNYCYYNGLPKGYNPAEEMNSLLVGCAVAVVFGVLLVFYEALTLATEEISVKPTTPAPAAPATPTPAPANSLIPDLSTYVPKYKLFYDQVNDEFKSLAYLLTGKEVTKLTVPIPKEWLNTVYAEDLVKDIMQKISSSHPEEMTTVLNSLADCIIRLENAISSNMEADKTKEYNKIFTLFTSPVTNVTNPGFGLDKATLIALMEPTQKKYAK